MKGNSRQKILSYVLVLVVIIAGIYYYNLYGGSLFSSDASSDISTDESGVAVGEDVLILVQKLDSTNINDSVFASPLFAALKDSSISVNSEEKFRLNPFAPLPGSVTKSQTR